MCAANDARTLPRFKSRSPLRAELKSAVDEYFEKTGVSRGGGAPMVLKTLTIFAWAIASYLLLLFWATSWWTAIPLAISLGMAGAGIGFSVMHDGGHGAYSTRPRLNRWSSYALDLLGGSSFVWAFKHNVLHHTYTNCEGVDDDLESQPFFRLSPGQDRHWFHRFQFLYWPFLLIWLSPKWILFDDFLAVGRGKLLGHTLPKLSGRDWVVLVSGKLAFAVWAVVIPLLFVDVVPYLVCAAVMFATQGLALGIVFQMAHAMDGASFYSPGPGEDVALPWAEHQIATTVDFARSNPLLTWYVGGLNFQVEHHLFPRVGHRHYPALAPIVREVCARHGIQLHEHSSLFGAFSAHIRHLYKLGRPVPATATAVAA